MTIDRVLFDSQPDDGIRPSGLRNAIAASAASTASTAAEAFLEDVGTLVERVSVVANNGGVVFVASPSRAVQMALRMPHELPRVTILATNSVADDLICFAPAALVFAGGAVPAITSAQASVLHMSDTRLGRQARCRELSQFEFSFL